MTEPKEPKVMPKMVAEAQAARNKYGEVLSAEEEFLLQEECEAIVDKYKNDAEVLGYMRYVLAVRIYELYEEKGRAEGWSDEKTVEEYFKASARQEN